MKLYDLRGKRTWVAGHRGMVGRALVRRLRLAGADVLTADRGAVDLRRQDAVERWIQSTRPEAVFVAAATVGGIEANRTRPAEFLYDNAAIALNVIHAAAGGDVEKLMFLGASCFYPREAEQPVQENALMSGPLEPTNEWYALAKIMGARLCQACRRQFGRDFIAAVPTNLYGPGDNFDTASSHVIPALIRKAHEAKLEGRGVIEIWGTGLPEREFLYVEDAAEALVFLMEYYSEEDIINVAGGQTVRIRELAELVAEATGYTGSFHFDTSRPDGMPRKALDPSRLRSMGWRPKTDLRTGIAQTCEWFINQTEFS
jgi:GDP-L-fucose synthase